MGEESETTSFWLLIGCQALGDQFVQTCTEEQTEEEEEEQAVALQGSPEVGGWGELPGSPGERWGGTAVLPVVLVALVQVGPADVPVDDLVHCNTRRGRRQNHLSFGRTAQRR